MLGILQNLWKAGDDVTLDLHWGYRHQLHKLCGQFLQIIGHGKMERSVIHGGYSTQRFKKKTFSVITAERLANCHCGDYYLAVHDSVKPFEVVDDDARNTEPPIYSAAQKSKQ